MYRIIKSDGTTLAVTETIRYIKVSDNGCYIQATKNDAVGIAHNGTPYNVRGHADIANAEIVSVQEFDGGKAIEQLEANQIAIEDALCELDMLGGMTDE